MEPGQVQACGQVSCGGVVVVEHGREDVDEPEEVVGCWHAPILPAPKAAAFDRRCAPSARRRTSSSMTPPWPNADNLRLTAGTPAVRGMAELPLVRVRG
ncbi:hypothetical protein GCM10009872_25850 [Actinopolymorpha rutila]